MRRGTLMTPRDISNYENIIDSRSIIERIEELEANREDVKDGFEPTEDAMLLEALTEWDYSDEGTELKALKALAEEGESVASDWPHGATLIRESYFTEYAQQLADDIGFSIAQKWPNNHIDWNAAAEELKQDYTEVDFDGVTYLVRS
jgi:hypothetical protein